uniref:Uncharacterized protein n=1 Tax=Onchocerca volvulus TaxID=6282 RepID=A0A8R1XZX3_ONCVO
MEVLQKLMIQSDISLIINDSLQHKVPKKVKILHKQSKLLDFYLLAFYEDNLVEQSCKMIEKRNDSNMSNERFESEESKNSNLTMTEMI